MRRGLAIMVKLTLQLDLKYVYLARSILLIFIIATPLAHAETSKKTLIIGVEDNRYMPHYSYENGEYIGFGRDVLDAFFSEMQYSYRYRALPVARLFQTFLDQGVDFKYPDNAIWSEEAKKGHEISYSQPVVTHIDGVSVLRENLGRHVDEIRLLGTVRGFTAWPWIDRIKSGKTILSENSSTKRLIQQTVIGRIQGAFANISVIQYMQNNYMDQKNALVFDESLPHTKGSYRLSSIAHPEIIQQFDAWLIKNKSLIDDLKARYGITELD